MKQLYEFLKLFIVGSFVLVICFMCNISVSFAEDEITANMQNINGEQSVQQGVEDSWQDQNNPTFEGSINISEQGMEVYFVN